MPNQWTKKTEAAGVPVADENLAHVLPGPSNAELNAKHEAAEAKRKADGYPKVEVLRDTTARAPEVGEDFDRQLEAWEDPEFDPLGITDPMQALKSTYGRPGMALKLLSDSVCNHLGKRNYRIVKDENGDPVRMGKMVLGEIPEKFAAIRRKKPILEAAEQLGQIEATQMDIVAKLGSESGMGLSAVRDGDTVNNHGDGRTYDMGLVVNRGERPDSD
jgi:hypothetical protein